MNRRDLLRLLSMATAALLVPMKGIARQMPSPPYTIEDILVVSFPAVVKHFHPHWGPQLDHLFLRQQKGQHHFCLISWGESDDADNPRESQRIAIVKDMIVNSIDSIEEMVDGRTIRHWALEKTPWPRTYMLMVEL